MFIMSFRFQKRVRVAPGLRLNISKRGVSTSVGRRGASVTLGRRGLYGNVGIPGSGVSYRTKLDKSANRRSKSVGHHKANNITTNEPLSVSLKFDKQSYSVVIVDENDQKVPPDIERLIRRENRDEIQKLYKQKEAEINEQTTKLLELHKQTFQERTPQQLKQLSTQSISFDLPLPNEKEIFSELKAEAMGELSILNKLKLFLPSERKAFLDNVQKEAKEQYKTDTEKYEREKEKIEQQKQQRINLVEKIVEGDIDGMELWLEDFLADLDFPLETNVSFNVLSANTVYLDVDLPQMEEIPLNKASILKSGKLKVQNKSQREMREHYATMVGGTALHLCSYVFSLLPTCDTIIISGYTQVHNEATGHLDDQYIYSLKVDKATFYSLNIAEVHPIAAFENFEPIMNATKTYIFKEIEPYEPLESD